MCENFSVVAGCVAIVLSILAIVFSMIACIASKATQKVLELSGRHIEQRPSTRFEGHQQTTHTQENTSSHNKEKEVPAPVPLRPQDIAPSLANPPKPKGGFGTKAN